MRILNAKLTKGGREYRASVAVSNNMAVEDFMEVLKASLPIPEASVVGFKDSAGVIIIPSLVCSEPEVLTTEEYEVILRERAQSAQSTPRVNLEDKILGIVSEMRMHRVISEDQYFSIATWIREHNSLLFQSFQKFMASNDLEGFKQWVLRKTKPSRQPSQQSEELRPSTSGAMRSSRQPDSLRDYQKFIQVVVEMENRRCLDQRDLGIIKTLILRDHPEVMREFEAYFLHSIDIFELSRRLQGLANDLSASMERPSSPLPRKNELQKLVNTLLRANIPSETDMEILNTLIAEDNEFVFAAFDVFESDRDTTELMDSLSRAIAKRKRAPTEEFDKEQFEDMGKRLEITKHWDPDLNGTFKSLLKNNSKAVARAFELYSKTEDLEILESQLYVICSCYFQVLLSRYFTFEQIKDFRRESMSEDSKVDVSLKEFSEDGNALKLVQSFASLAGVVIAVRVDPWVEILAMLENTHETKMDLFERLHHVISSSTGLEAYRAQLLELYEDMNPELMNILESLHSKTDYVSAEEKIKVILDTSSKYSPELIEKAQNQISPEFRNLFNEYLETENPGFMGAMEVFAKTQDVEEFKESFEILIQCCSQDFERFVADNFTSDQQEAILKMQREEDSRLKAALDVLDIKTDKEELIETIVYLLNS